MNNKGLLPDNVEGCICGAGNEAPVLCNTSRKNALRNTEKELLLFMQDSVLHQDRIFYACI